MTCGRGNGLARKHVECVVTCGRGTGLWTCMHVDMGVASHVGMWHVGIWSEKGQGVGIILRQGHHSAVAWQISAECVLPAPIADSGDEEVADIVLPPAARRRGLARTSIAC